MSEMKEEIPNLSNKPENGDDINADYEDEAIILNLTEPHKATNDIPPKLIDITDKNIDASSKELHAHVSSTKEAPISHESSQVNDEERRNDFRENSIDIVNNRTNNINSSLDVSNAKDLKEDVKVTDNNAADILNKIKPVHNDDGQNINYKSDESTNVDTDYDLSDEDKTTALDFSDSDLPDSPEIEKRATSFQKEVITEDELSETEQKNSSDTEEFNPFVFRKKKSKPVSTVTLDLNTLPSRVSTRYRKPFLDNVTAKILKPTYLTEQEAQIDADIVTENIKRLKVYNEFKGVLKKTNENISQNKTDNRNNKTKEVSTTISGTEISNGKSDDSNKQEEQNKTEIEPTSTLATTIINRITRSNNKITEHKPFELACTRLQQEINSSINKNRSFYKTPEKESSKSPELVGKLRIPHEALKEVLKSSETTQSNLQKSPTRVSTSSDSVATRKGPQKTKHRRSIPDDSQQEVLTLFRSVVTRSRLKESSKQVSKPAKTAVTQVRPPNMSKQISTSSDSAATLNISLEPPKQVPKPNKTQITRSKARITSLTKVPKLSDNEVKLSEPRQYPKQPESNSTDAVLTRNRANKSVITPSLTQESAKQVSLSVLEPLKHESRYPKIVITRFNPEDYQKQISASSKSVVTRNRLKDSSKQVSKPPETNIKFRPPETSNQIPTLCHSETTRSRSQQAQKEVSKSSEMIVTPSRPPKTTARRRIPQESQIDVSKSSNTIVTRRRIQDSKTQIFTRRKPQNTVNKQSKILTTRSRQEKTEVAQIRPQKSVVTQSRPKKTLGSQNKLQKSIVTRSQPQSKLLKTVTTRSRPEESGVTQIRPQKTVNARSGLEKTVTTRSRPEETSVTQIRPQNTITTCSRPEKTIVTRRRLQKTVIIQNKPHQTQSRKIPSLLKTQLKNKECTVKTSKSVQKNSSHKQSTVSNASSSAKTPRSLKRSLRSSDAPSAKRTRLHKPSIQQQKHTQKKVKETGCPINLGNQEPIKDGTSTSPI